MTPVKIGYQYYGDSTIVGPTLEPAEFTLSAMRKARRDLQIPRPEGMVFTGMVNPVVLPERAMPETIPGIVFTHEFGSSALALGLTSKIPPGMRLVGLVECFLIIAPRDRAKPKDVPVLYIRADEEDKYRDMPNFIPAEKLSRRMSGPHEVGALASSVTTKYGIGFSRGQSYGELICFVELAKEEVHA